jgi:hypothetical protein
MLGITDKDLGQRPCNCRSAFKVNGNCAYGGDTSCRTAGIVYKISCKGKNGNSACNCFYIGKSQRYTKTRIQEHIGEVTKLYDKLVSSHNRATHPPPQLPNSQASLRSSDSSLATQDSAEPLESSQSPPVMCVVIDPPPSPSPQGPATRLRSTQSTGSSTDDLQIALGHPPDVNFVISPRLRTQRHSQQENCSTLARHLFAHVRHLRFCSKVEVATWCRSHINVEVVYRASTIGLVKTAGTKMCCLCAAERMILGQSIPNARRRTKILNLKSELHGNCTCKARFLRFSQSN